MQGLADGYFVLPYTIGQYFASHDQGEVTTEHQAFADAENETNERVNKFLSIRAKRSVDSFHRELGKIMWEQCGMERTAEGLNKALKDIPALRAEFYENVNVTGAGDNVNMEREKAGRVADFLEFGETLRVMP